MVIRHEEQLQPAGAQWCGQHCAHRVDGLPQALLVDPSGELSDQNRSHPLEAQLLMNAQEFDLRHSLLPADKYFEPHLPDISSEIAAVWCCEY